MSWRKNTYHFSLWYCPGKETDPLFKDKPIICYGDTFKFMRNDEGRHYLVCQECGEEFEVAVAINDQTEVPAGEGPPISGAD